MNLKVGELPSSPACERNREPICEVLKQWLSANARVLEIGAGTGQHAVYFSAQMPGVHWQATDLSENLNVVRRRFELESSHLPEPLALDVMCDEWPEGPFDAIFTANTLHIMPWSHTPVLLQRAAERLADNGLLIIYGPFHDAGSHTAESNQRFDRTLRARDPEMGVRDATEIRRQAGIHGLVMAVDIAMPANNRILIFERFRAGSRSAGYTRR